MFEMIRARDMYLIQKTCDDLPLIIDEAERAAQILRLAVVCRVRLHAII